MKSLHFSRPFHNNKYYGLLRLCILSLRYSNLHNQKGKSLFLYAKLMLKYVVGQCFLNMDLHQYSAEFLSVKYMQAIWFSTDVRNFTKRKVPVCKFILISVCSYQLMFLKCFPVTLPNERHYRCVN